MFSFLLEEGVLTVGTMSGLFTAAMLNSFRVNILEPVIEHVVPSHILDTTGADVIMQPTVNLSEKDKTLIKSNLDGSTSTTQPSSSLNPKKIVKWKTFLRDFITWVLVMLVLYMLWKHVLQKFKKKN